MLDTVLFYSFATLVLGGGIFTITRRSPVHSAIALIVALLGVAGLYLLQQAEFLFAVQIVLYVGGIMLLFLFVIMLVNLDDAEHVREFNRQWAVALAAVAAVGAAGFYIFHGGAAVHHVVYRLEAVPAAAVGNTEALADSLFSEYLLPFELVSVLLLVAVVGSVVMAKKRI